MSVPTTAVGVSAAGISLETLLQTLGSTVASTTSAPAKNGVLIRSVTLLDSFDLVEGDRVGPHQFGDLCVVVGAPASELLAWLSSLAVRDRGQRPRAVATKIVSDDLDRAARKAGVALVAVHPQARIGLVLSTVRSVLAGATHGPLVGYADEPTAGEHDLYGLAQTVATMTGGLVAIEDERAQMLAYSASDGLADELRMLSILGREGPADYLRRLREWGVYDRLRRERGAIEVPADDELGWRRRLAVDIRAFSDRPGPAAEPSLGTVWLQEGSRALDPDAAAVLEGAAVLAARLIERSRSAPTQEALQIQRLLGLRGGGVDVPSLAAALSMPASGPATVVGITGESRPDGMWPTVIHDVAAAVRLHAGAYARESLVTTTEQRIYLLIPQVRTTGLSAWVASMLERLGRRAGLTLRAAVATPVAALTDLGSARAEVDRVLDRVGTDRVSTLADSRTSVLLGEIADLVAEQEQLRDPRLQTLIDDDELRGGSLVESVERYLDRFGDVRAAAAELHVHPNTLRYRIRRAEHVLGMSLDDSEDRLLLQIQLQCRRRRA
ncbi:MAG: helix-turn-helix domain-containing protein [Microlunatus sp.]